MLEIRDICKTYTPKKGDPVRALDHISLKFADHGLVFLLGKSGSGKSTLLNVIGGLDRADSGDFIIKGKSSHDFTQSDFDAYRNTFIGFVFQEYNILNEFSVGANIALAMELQGKKATPEALNAILEEVDLVDYANRRPNELSGGQKQRIAIARALIKEPEVIMADEPTGALDSKTGIQIFDTLKKLSKTKLVLVVSHDRDFAEQYGDRVIELADGKVISDITKFTLEPHMASEGVSMVDESILRIRPGYQLTAADVTMINEFLSRAEKEAIFSVDTGSNEKFKRMAMITEDGSRESFRKTDEKDLNLPAYDGKKTKFIRSRLPQRNAAKIALSSLKVKPFRLFLTILLSFVAFSLFGLADTVGAYDSTTTMVSSILDSNIENASFELAVKRMYGEDPDDFYWETHNTRFSDARIAELSKLMNGATVKGVSVLPDSSFSSHLISSASLSNTQAGYSAYKSSFRGAASISQDELNALGFTLTGKLPESNSEIVISRLTYEVFKLCGYTYTPTSDNWSGKPGSSTEPEESPIRITGASLTDDDNAETGILGKKISLSSYYSGMPKTYTVVGIIDTHFDSTRYTEFIPTKDKPQTTTGDDGMDIGLMMKMQELESVLQYGYHNLCYVTAEELVTLSQQNSYKTALPFGVDGNSLNAYFNRQQNGMAHDSTEFYFGFSANYLSSLADFNQYASGKIYWLSSPLSALADGQMLLPISLFQDVVGKSNISLDVTSYTVGVQTPYDQNTRTAITLSELYNNLANEVAAYRYAESAQGAAEATSEEFIAFAASYASEFFYNPDNPSEPLIPDAAILQSIYAHYLARTDSSKNDQNIPMGGYYENPFGNTTGSELEYAYKAELLKTHWDTLKQNIEPLTVSCQGQTASLQEASVEIVGFTAPYYQITATDGSNFSVNTFDYVVSDQLVAMQGEDISGIYSFVILPMPKDAEGVRKLAEIHYNTDGTVRYQMKNAVVESLDMVDSIVEELATVFFWVGFAFAVFSALMLSNFIAISISHKKREIGILRAVGARSGDVFRIFFTESLFIALINFILAVIATAFASAFINNILREDAGLLLTFLNFGIRQVLLMLAVSVLVALVASFLPVYKIARKLPVDAIQDR